MNAKSCMPFFALTSPGHLLIINIIPAVEREAAYFDLKKNTVTEYNTSSKFGYEF